MCSGEYSSSIRKNREQFPPIINNYPPNFFEQIKPFLDAVKIVRLQGGEPFLIDDYLRIIEYLGENNKNCKIYIQTNGTIFNKRVEKILANNQIHLSISMDSLNQRTLESIRKNINFIHFRKNLEQFSAISKKNNSVLNINFCLMKNNWTELPALFEFCFDNNYSLNIIPIDFPIIYSLEHLSIDELDSIQNYIRENTKEPHKGYFKLIFNSLFNSLDEIKIKAIQREEKIELLLAENTEYLILKIIKDLENKALYEYNIGKIKYHIDEKLEKLNPNLQKFVLANTILNNNVLVNVNLKIDYVEDKITQRIIEYFDYEIALLN
jgi:organic radical activating enzyme